MKNYDYLIIGAGIIGVQVALRLRKLHPDATIAVLEKEKVLGEHSSGRNSGVLHAGFYYKADSLKSKFTAQGNALLTAYCDEKGIKINKCGKFVVATDEKELEGLQVLFDRGRANKIPIEEISAEELEEQEPGLNCYKKALFSPTTSSVNPKEVLNSFHQDAEKLGIEFHFETKYLHSKDKVVITSKGDFQFGYLINAAGLYADTIAKEFGCSQNYKILPFKGLYLYGPTNKLVYKKHIYPVPNLGNPFLGVHSTNTVDGITKIGPTAIPAFWRENYKGFSRFQLKEFASIIADELGLLFFSDFGFHRLAIEETKKFNKGYLISQAQKYMPKIDPSEFTKWGKAGIRAQLFDTKQRKLEMDFVIEQGESSLHVLNAVSPAFTSSIPFAQYICEHIEEK